MHNFYKLFKRAISKKYCIKDNSYMNAILGEYKFSYILCTMTHMKNICLINMFMYILTKFHDFSRYLLNLNLRKILFFR